MSEQPYVVGIYTAPAPGAPMEPHDMVEVIAGIGIPGDRYATKTGHWSAPRWPDKELTLVEAEVADDLKLPVELFRRNVAIRGAQLLGLIGLRFRIGDVEFAGMRPCNPCQYLEELLERPGLLRDLVGHGGLRTKVLVSGHLRIGDEIEVLGVHDPDLVGIGVEYEH